MSQRCCMGFRSGDMDRYSMWGTPTCWRCTFTTQAQSGGMLSSINMKFWAYWCRWGMMIDCMISCRYDWPGTVSLSKSWSVFLSIEIPAHTGHPPPQFKDLGPCWWLHSTHPMPPVIAVQVDLGLIIKGIFRCKFNPWTNTSWNTPC